MHPILVQEKQLVFLSLFSPWLEDWCIHWDLCFHMLNPQCNLVLSVTPSSLANAPKRCRQSHFSIVLCTLFQRHQFTQTNCKVEQFEVAFQEQYLWVVSCEYLAVVLSEPGILERTALSLKLKSYYCIKSYIGWMLNLFRPGYAVPF